MSKLTGFKNLLKEAIGLLGGQDRSPTAQPVGFQRAALDVLGNMTYVSVGTDTTEANSTAEVIVATAHLARQGDIIKITSGSLSPIEVIVDSVDTNSIYLAQRLPSALGAGINFTILRSSVPVVNSAGALSTTAVLSGSGPIQFSRNAVATDVSEDTATPANSRPLPVKAVDGSGVVISPLTDTQLRATAVPVSGPLTDAQLRASTVPVVLNDTTASGNITTQNLVPAGTATANSTVPIALNNQGAVAIQVTGTYTGALTPQVTVDGSTWVALALLQNVSTGALSATITSAATGVFLADVSGFSSFRISANAAVTGTAVVSLRATTTSGLTAIDTPLPAGTNVLGALVANQSVNVAQIAGTNTVTAGVSGLQAVGGNAASGAADAGNPVKVGGLFTTTPPTLTTGQRGNFLVDVNGRQIISNATGRTVVTTVRNAYATTSVTTGAWVQLVASTSAAIHELEIFDSSGQTLEIGTGAAAAEARLIIVYPGGNGRVPVLVASGTRLSIRAISATASAGELNINAYGV